MNNIFADAWITWNDFKIDQSNNPDDYIVWVCDHKKMFNLTWQEIADLLNGAFYNEYSEAYYRRRYKKLQELNQSYEEQLTMDLSEFELAKKKVKHSDEKVQINGLIRALSREETLKDIAREVAQEMKDLTFLTPAEPFVDEPTDKEATLCLSDWHYGLEYDGYHNIFDTEVARERITYLLDRVRNICAKEDIRHINVINMGDLISGRIHMPLRLNSRIDVITQTMEVSEILAEFLSQLTMHFDVTYMSVTDNHSRVEPKKKEALQIESFARIIDWYVEERLKRNDRIAFAPNIFGDDIAYFIVQDHPVLAVHGDKDRQSSIIRDLPAYTGERVDMILSAHMHHFSANEDADCVLYCNGSLIGTDDYAASLRVTSPPSQLLIISTPNAVDEVVYKIRLNG